MSNDERFGRLFELSTDAVADIAITDGAPVVRAVNPAFVDVFGYERADIVGESLNDFIVPEERAAEAASFDERSAQGEENWATVTRRTADGRREFLYRSVPFEAGGQQRALAIYTDITDEKRRERHHQVLHRVLRHNLRNDLTTMLAATTEILSRADDEAVREQARRIRAGVEDLEELSHTAGMVEDLLGDGTGGTEPVDLAETLRGLARQYRSSQKAVTVETDLPASVRVTADERLDAALDALVENAVEHGRPGAAPAENDGEQTGAMENATDGGGSAVRITLAEADTEAVARIVDNGPGIPEYERAAVFDEEPLSQLSHGSGLGLWLAKWVVESYGGRLSYERRGGETTVAVRVPLAD